MHPYLHEDYSYCQDAFKVLITLLIYVLFLFTNVSTTKNRTVVCFNFSKNSREEYKKCKSFMLHLSQDVIK